jgi:hypothetical protein
VDALAGIPIVDFACGGHHMVAVTGMFQIKSRLISLF